MAIAWLLGRPACTAPIVGARTAAPLTENLYALGVQLDDAQRSRLDQASATAPIFPTRFLERPMLQQLIFGTTSVERRDGVAGR